MRTSAILVSAWFLQLCCGFAPVTNRPLRFSSRVYSETETEVWDAPASVPTPEEVEDVMKIVVGEGEYIGDDGELTNDWVGKVDPAKLAMQELSPSEAAEQKVALDKLAKEWKYARELREYEESQLLGMTPQAEIINGRMAMFFIFVGILTEAFSGESMPTQVMTMLETFGVVEL